MLFFRNPMLFVWLAVILIGALITAMLLNKWTPLAWDPALAVAYGAWVGGSLVILIVRMCRSRKKRNRYVYRGKD